MSVLSIDIQSQLMAAYPGSKKAESDYISKEIARHLGEAGHGIEVFMEMLDAYRNQAKTGYCPEWRELRAFLPRKVKDDEPRTVMGLTLDADHFAALSEAYSAAGSKIHGANITGWSRIAELMEAFARYYPADADLCWHHRDVAIEKAKAVAAQKEYWAKQFGSGPRLKVFVPVVERQTVDEFYGRQGTEA